MRVSPFFTFSNNSCQNHKHFNYDICHGEYRFEVTSLRCKEVVYFRKEKMKLMGGYYVSICSRR